MLEQSLHGAALIELGLQEQSDAIMNPWRLVVQEADHPACSLASGMHVTQVYDQAEGELLILGAPGAGKTTLLLRLARDLLTRAKQDESHPIPIVLNLSSWTTKCQPLAEWLVDELNGKYQVPLKLGREWIAEDKILPLLDGLDEVKREYRAACVEAINAYRQEHGLVSVVVCCRSTDNEALGPSTRLLLHSAILVQPLTAKQIDDYLVSGGEKLSAVREVLQTDPDLQEMAATPLMLSVLTLAYAGRRPDDLLAASSPQLRRQQIFATYIERMLHRRGAETQYTPQQIKQWLSCLAQQMTQHSQAEFYLERMQPTWLSSASEWLPLLFGALVRVSIGVFFGVIACLALWLHYVLNPQRSASLFPISSRVLVNGLIFGLVGAIVYGLVSPAETNIKPAEIIVWSWKSYWQRLRKSKALRIGLIFALAFGVLGMLYGVIHHSIEPSWIYTSLLLGLLEGLIFRWLYESMEELSRNMQCISREHRSWQFVHNRVLVGLIFGIIEGLLTGLLIGSLGIVIVIMRLTGQPQKDSGVMPLGLICLIIGGGTGVLSWLIFGVTSRVEIEFKPLKILVWLARSIYQYLGKSEELTRGLAIVLIFGVFRILTAELSFGPSDGLPEELFAGLLSDCYLDSSSGYAVNSPED